MHIEDAVGKAKRLFLEFSNEFELEFDQEIKIYRLKTKRCNKLHPLESVLLGYDNMTGYKIKDICAQINKSYRWILGFIHGYEVKKINYKNKYYIDGFASGQSIRKKIDNET